MKKIYLLISFSLVSAFAIAQWTWQNPLPQGNSLSCVKFVDLNNGYAVGSNGTILKTTNGGSIFSMRETKLIESTFTFTPTRPPIKSALPPTATFKEKPRFVFSIGMEQSCNRINSKTRT